MLRTTPAGTVSGQATYEILLIQHFFSIGKKTWAKCQHVIDAGSESRRGTIASLLASGRFSKRFVGFVFVDNVDDRNQCPVRRRPIFYDKLSYL